MIGQEKNEFYATTCIGASEITPNSTISESKHNCIVASRWGIEQGC